MIEFDIPIWAWIVILVLFIYSIVLHEIAHGYMAFIMGDYTAKRQGRLTFNPLVHIDPFMTIILPLLTFYFFHFIFGGAKPVPVDPRKLRNSKRDMILIAAAGPLTNLLLASIFALLIHSPIIRPNTINWYILLSLAFFNVFIALFNLIPIPPLDGSRILKGILPYGFGWIFDFLEYNSFFVFLILLITRLFDVIAHFILQSTLYIMIEIFHLYL